MESLYICIDESGTLSQTEEYFVFAGYCLTSDEKYLGKSRKLQEEKENFNALEMKGTSVSVNTRNQILAIMNNQHPFAIVIKNQNIPTNIFEYHQGVALYKDELLSLIITKVLASFDLTRFNKITIIIDEQNLASNTSHNLYHKVYRRLFTGFFEQENILNH